MNDTCVSVDFLYDEHDICQRLQVNRVRVSDEQNTIDVNGILLFPGVSFIEFRFLYRRNVKAWLEIVHIRFQEMLCSFSPILGSEISSSLKGAAFPLKGTTLQKNSLWRRVTCFGAGFNKKHF
jgi:hypothetical protein